MYRSRVKLKVRLLQCVSLLVMTICIFHIHGLLHPGGRNNVIKDDEGDDIIEEDYEDTHSTTVAPTIKDTPRKSYESDTGPEIELDQAIIHDELQDKKDKEETEIRQILYALEKDELEEHAFARQLVQKSSQSSSSAKGLHILIVSVKVNPMLDVTFTLNSLGVKATQLDLSFHCYDGGCDNKVLRDKLPSNIFTLTQQDLISFSTSLATDTDFHQFDAFLCIYPVILCQLFLPLNKPVILYIEDRYEAGASSMDQWKILNNFIKHALSDPRHEVLVSNSYDRKYIEHFTGW